MKYCKKCAYPENHPFGIIFDSNGVCSGCNVHDEKDTLDWNERINKLHKLLDRYKNTSKNNYDCIIPVSGDKDSYYVVDIIKNHFNMNPLLVSYNTHFNTLTGIRNLQNLKTKFGCDLYQQNVNPEFAKKIVRYSLKKMGSIFWHNHAGSTVFPIHIATRLNIPLIIWGLHQGVDQVGMFSHEDEVEMTRKYRKEHDLMGFEAEDLVDLEDFPSEIKNDMKKYFYPTDDAISKVALRGIYLSNYIRWDSKTQHEKMIKKYDYNTLGQIRTFNTYENVSNLLYDDIHDYIKMIKHGYSKVTDHVCQEIRLNRMSREEGVSSINYYQKNKIRHKKLFLEWLGMDGSEFDNNLDKFRNFSEINGDFEINGRTKYQNEFIVNSVEKDNPELHSFYKGLYL